MPGLRELVRYSKGVYTRKWALGNIKRSIFEVRENVCFACTEEVIPSSTR